MANNDWLLTLAAGDEVAVSYGIDARLQKVVKTTKTQIVLNNETRYNRSTGHRCGQDSWNSSWLVKVTPELRERLLRQKLVARAVSLVVEKELNKLPTKSLEKLISLFKPEVKGD